MLSEGAGIASSFYEAFPLWAVFEKTVELVKTYYTESTEMLGYGVENNMCCHAWGLLTPQLM